VRPQDQLNGVYSLLNSPEYNYLIIARYQSFEPVTKKNEICTTGLAAMYLVSKAARS